MSGFESLLGDWHFWVLTAGYYAYSAFVGGMPPPVTGDAWRYVWLYRSLHLLAANVKTAMKKD